MSAERATRRTPASRTARLARAVGPRLLRGVVTAVVTCLPVVALAVLVRENSAPLVELDQRLVVAASDVTRANASLRDGLIVWQEIFQPWHVYLAASPLVFAVYRAGRPGRAAWGLVTMLVGWNLGLDVKLLVERARPILDQPVSSAPGFSFPSGHAFNTAMAVATCIVMAWPLLRERSPVLRSAVLVAGSVVVVLTALDRVFLGVHFPSDVTAGILLALGLTAASWAGYRYTPADPTASKGPSS